MQDFLAAVAKRSRPVADIEQGYISTTSCILANLSMRTGRTMTWYPQKGRVIRDAEANRLLARPYRSPWAHPAPQNREIPVVRNNCQRPDSHLQVATSMSLPNYRGTVFR